MTVYYIDYDDYLHGCCWDAVIKIKRKMVEGALESDEETIILECDAKDAEFICAALNAAKKSIPIIRDAKIK
jgi:hypothetical protein